MRVRKRSRSLASALADLWHYSDSRALVSERDYEVLAVAVTTGGRAYLLVSLDDETPRWRVASLLDVVNSSVGSDWLLSTSRERLLLLAGAPAVLEQPQGAKGLPTIDQDTPLGKSPRPKGQGVSPAVLATVCRNRREDAPRRLRAFLPGEPNLKIGEEHEVHGVAIIEDRMHYLLLRGDFYTSFKLSWQFELPDSPIPSEWICSLFREVDCLLLGPDFVAGSLDAYQIAAESSQEVAGKLRRRVRARDAREDDGDGD